MQKLHEVLLRLATLECLFCMVLQLENGGVCVGKLLLRLLVLSILVPLRHGVVRLEQTLGLLKSCLFAKLAGDKGRRGVGGLADIERATHVMGWDHTWLERLIGLSEGRLRRLGALNDQSTF